MSDNTTPALATEYDAHIGTVNPNYRLFHTETLDLAAAVNPSPNRWLDTGCGTGTLVAAALERFPQTEFLLADPFAGMLAAARAKLSQNGNPKIRFAQMGTHELALPDDSQDVITAMLSHHYYQPDQRRNATQNCFRMLRPGGVCVTFEHVRPNSDAGLRIGLARWGKFQRGMGRNQDEVEKHLMRFDSEYFPITVEQHLELLRDTGFSAVEMLFLGVMQAGFYAIK